MNPFLLPHACMWSETPHILKVIEIDLKCTIVTRTFRNISRLF